MGKQPKRSAAAEEILKQHERSKKRRRDNDRRARMGFGFYNAKVMKHFKMNRFFAKAAQNKIRIAPAGDTKYFAREISAHYSIGDGDTNFLCRKEMLGKECPICDMYEKLSRRGNKKIARDFRAGTRFLMLVVDMSSRKAMKQGVSVYDLPPTVHDGILDKTIQAGGGVIEVADLETGCLVGFTRTGEGMSSRYSDFLIGKPRPFPSGIKQNFPGWDELLNFPKVSDMTAALATIDIADLTSQNDDFNTDTDADEDDGSAPFDTDFEDETASETDDDEGVVDEEEPEEEEPEEEEPEEEEPDEPEGEPEESEEDPEEEPDDEGDSELEELVAFATENEIPVDDDDDADDVAAKINGYEWVRANLTKQEIRMIKRIEGTIT